MALATAAERAAVAAAHQNAFRFRKFATTPPSWATVMSAPQ